MKEAVQYFKEEPGFSRLLTFFIQKYRGLNRIGGKVRIQDLTDPERSLLTSILRKDFSLQDSAIVSLQEFEEGLQYTRFEGITLKEILDGCAGYEIVSKKQEIGAQQQRKLTLLRALAETAQTGLGRKWIEAVVLKEKGTQRVHLLFQRDSDKLEACMKVVLRVLDRFPLDEPVRLPFLAAEVSGDPHGLDRNTEEGEILLDALQILRVKNGIPFINSPRAEEVTEILNYFSIVRDDVLNFTSCMGILALEGGQPLSTWESACWEGTVLNMPLRELKKGLIYRTWNGQRTVFVVENSGVFSNILDGLKGMSPSLVCTHGQVKLASLILLDGLAREGFNILYAGDFDPEGIRIAERLAFRYGERFSYWRMTKQDYLQSVSKREIGRGRMKMLEGVRDERLSELISSIRQTAKAGYQENLAGKLIEDILKSRMA